ncbi:MAG: hypothetical protein LQ343_000055 [Gyalolechia ehrenbergii]|nr:MAG: hypothetical protein LQ343_000055 [Gyalolechia ehrenbergii]
MTTPKISVYSISDLKNTTDDALPNYLTSLKFRQSHYLTDIRLGLGYTAVAIAAVTFYADYKLGWDATKFWTMWAVIAYFILNGTLTYWIWGVEKGQIFNGEINDTSIVIASSVSKHKPVYNLKVQYGKAGKEIQTLTRSAPFTQWFDSDGYFVAAPFQRWLASEIPLVGEADPQKAGSGVVGNEARKTVEAQTTQQMDPPAKASAPRPRKSKKAP